MNIAYSCNDYYIPQTGISMISLFENNRDEKEINVYFISKEVSAENIELLRSIADKYERKLIVVSFESIAYDLKLSAIGRHIETIYSKVFFSRIKDINKIIYFDSDTIICDKLNDMWETDLTNCYMGVVETFPTKYYKELNLPKGEKFFNDGMAIVNVSYCRENHLIERVLEVVSEFEGAPPTLSEGALNKVCYGHVKYVSPKYNLLAGILYNYKLDPSFISDILHYSKDEIQDSCENPVVIHFLTDFYNRPWNIGCKHPYKELFYKYKKISPWSDAPLINNPLPWRLRIIDMGNRIVGPKKMYAIRKVFRRL